MTEGRERELLDHISTLTSVAEAHGFRQQLKDQDEQLSSAVYAALLSKIDRLNKLEAKG